ncbi:Bacterial regulatory protein, tetR family [compost metagenome]
MIQLLHEKDFKEISVTDIVQLANLNRGTFYRHYQYKEELFEAILEDVTTDLIRSYREPYLSSATFEVGKLTSSAVKIFDHVAKYAYFYTLIANTSVLAGFQHRICLVFKTLALQDLIHTPSVPGKLNEELQASYQAYAILGMIIEWINNGFRYSSAYMAEQLVAIIHFNSTDVIFTPHISEFKLDTV